MRHVTSVFVNDSANFTRTIQSDDINGNATFAINVTHHAVDAFGDYLVYIKHNRVQTLPMIRLLQSIH